LGSTLTTTVSGCCFEATTGGFSATGAASDLISLDTGSFSNESFNTVLASFTDVDFISNLTTLCSVCSSGESSGLNGSYAAASAVSAGLVVSSEMGSLTGVADSLAILVFTTRLRGLFDAGAAIDSFDLTLVLGAS